MTYMSDVFLHLEEKLDSDHLRFAKVNLQTDKAGCDHEQGRFRANKEKGNYNTAHRSLRNFQIVLDVFVRFVRSTIH